MSKLKENVEHIFVVPLAKHLKINPNSITLLSVVAMAFAFISVLRQEFYMAALFTFISGYLDLLDGTVAKYHRKVTKFGAFLDRVVDRINDALIISAVVLSGLVSLYLGLFVLLFTLLSSYVSAVLESQTKSKIGEKLSLRGVRLMVIISGFILNSLIYAFYILAILSLVAFLERIYTAKIVIK